MKGNIYYTASEEAIELIKYRISEVEKEENENKDCHLPYQVLLKFFYDIRSVIND